MEVLIEIGALGGELLDWANGHRAHLFVEQTNQTQQNVRLIVNRFRTFIPEQVPGEWADPWVIVTAQERGGIVVTGEKLAGGGQGERPRIPDVCRALDVACLHTDDQPTPGLHFMMEREGWTF
jgi:hypothetical protein